LRKTLHTSEHEALLSTLRTAREKAGLTQAQLADRLGKPQSFVAKYENGERRIDVVEFVALARAMDTDPMRLFRALLKRADLSVGKSWPDGRRRTGAPSDFNPRRRGR